MNLTLWFSAIQAAGTLLVAVNLVYFVRQLKFMGRQIRAFEEDAKARERQFDSQAEQSSQLVRAQNMFEVIKYLESAEHLQARRRITQIHNSGKQFSTWSEEDREAADVVARIWTIAATWQQMGILPDEYLQRHYGNAIVRHWRVVAPYVEELRKRTESAQRRSFQEMAEEIEALGWYKDQGDARPEPVTPPVLANRRRTSSDTPG